MRGNNRQTAVRYPVARALRERERERARRRRANASKRGPR